MMRAVASLALIGLLAACGSRTELRPLPGMSAVPKAEAATTVPTATQLMTPTTQARPDRKAELLIRSEERKDDPFDLPPGPDNGKPGGSKLDADKLNAGKLNAGKQGSSN